MRKLLICLSLLLAAAQGLAGEIHYGNGLSRESACENAERRARRAALSKNTCYEQCEVRDCKKEDDGSFTCKADSANHRGSCGGGDKIDPKQG